MNLKRLFFWATVFCALLAYVVFFEKPEVKKQPRHQDELVKLFSMPRDNLTQVKIERDAQKALLVYTGGSWKTTSPSDGRVQSELIESLITTILDTVNLGVVEENPLNLEQYGLTRPAFILSLYLKGQKDPVVLDIGNNTPSNVSMYARLTRERRVIMVGTYLSFSVKMFMDNLK